MGVLFFLNVASLPEGVDPPCHAYGHHSLVDPGIGGSWDPKVDYSVPIIQEDHLLSASKK